MNDFSAVHLARMVTAIVFLALIFGLALGYVRILWAERTTRQPVVQVFSWSILLLVGLQGYRAFHTAFFGTMPEWSLALWNVFGMFAAYLGLKVLHLMIPEEERDQWHWYSAPMYPPLGARLWDAAISAMWNNDIDARDTARHKNRDDVRDASRDIIRDTARDITHDATKRDDVP